MPKIKVLRGNTSSLANYAGSAGEIALNYQTGNLVFWTNTANVYYTLAGAAAGGGGASPFQGSTAGYTIGGAPSYPTLVGHPSIIQKFTFSSGSPASNIGSFPSGQWVDAGGASSDSYGYVYGGYSITSHTSNRNDNIDKHPFSSDSSGSNVQTISPSTVPLNRTHSTGHQSLSTGYAYWPSHPGEIKMPFAADTTAVTYTADLGYQYTPTPLQIPVHQASGSTSTENRYKSGGYQPNVPYAGYFGLMRNPFSSDNAIILGSLVWGGYLSAGVSGETAGYAIGGSPNYNSSGSTPSPTILEHDNIQKYSFSSDGNATDVGQLAQTRQMMAGYSSTTDGYVTGGGVYPTYSGLDHIYKFPFSSESTVTDQAELVAGRFLAAATQV